MRDIFSYSVHTQKKMLKTDHGMSIDRRYSNFNECDSDSCRSIDWVLNLRPL